MSVRLLPPVRVPTPPPVAALRALDPWTTTWAAGLPIHRCYDIHWGAARVFAPGDVAHRGRFHPFTPEGASGDLPVLYGASDDGGALSETVFHDIPVRGVKSVPQRKLNRRVLVTLLPARPLALVDLTSDGLSRLGLARSELIESDPRSYPDTALWARALHDAVLHADGLLWVSRQHDTSRCVLLFEDRVPADALEVPDTQVPLTLGAGAGLDRVAVAANRAGITLTGL